MGDEVYESLLKHATKKLVSWAELAVDSFPNAVVALVICVLFWWLAKGAGAVTQRAFRRVRAEDGAARLMATLVRVIVVGTGGAIALGVLNLDRAAASLLAGAGIVGLALGFAFQDLAANLISGVGLALRREHPFKTGDLVETNDYLGKVSHIDLRTTTLETFDGKYVIIPNKEIYQGILVNHSTAGRRRVELTVGVSYGEDLPRVEQVVVEALRALPMRLEKEPRVFFREFADSSINFFCFFWIAYDSELQHLEAKHAAVLAIKQAFNEHEITIPFPIRTLDFGIKGGEKLSEQVGLRAGAGGLRLPSSDQS